MARYQNQARKTPYRKADEDDTDASMDDIADGDRNTNKKNSSSIRSKSKSKKKSKSKDKSKKNKKQSTTKKKGKARKKKIFSLVRDYPSGESDSDNDDQWDYNDCDGEFHPPLRRVVNKHKCFKFNFTKNVNKPELFCFCGGMMIVVSGPKTRRANQIFCDLCSKNVTKDHQVLSCSQCKIFLLFCNNLFDNKLFV